MLSNLDAGALKKAVLAEFAHNPGRPQPLRSRYAVEPKVCSLGRRVRVGTSYFFEHDLNILLSTGSLPGDGEEVRHVDGDVLNNAIGNLKVLKKREVAKVVIHLTNTEDGPTTPNPTPTPEPTEPPVTKTGERPTRERINWFLRAQPTDPEAFFWIRKHGGGNRGRRAGVHHEKVGDRLIGLDFGQYWAKEIAAFLADGVWPEEAKRARERSEPSDDAGARIVKRIKRLKDQGDRLTGARLDELVDAMRAGTADYRELQATGFAVDVAQLVEDNQRALRETADAYIEVTDKLAEAEAALAEEMAKLQSVRAILGEQP